MVRIDAKDLSTTEINRKIKDAADSADEITVLNPQARHNIAVGVLQPCKITIEGSVGYYAHRSWTDPRCISTATRAGRSART